MNNLPEAYRGADDMYHYICDTCEDHEEAEKLATGFEQKKELEYLIAGIFGYVKREISHTMCPPCLQDELRKLGEL